MGAELWQFGVTARYDKLTTDPGMGVVRHVDAGYPEAIAFAKQAGVKVPMMAE